MSTTTVWVNGTICDGADATVRALDHGMTVGDGVFETLKVVGGTPFALTRHLARLRRSAELLHLSLAMSDDDLRGWCSETVDAFRQGGEAPGRLRITITGGPGPLGSGRDDVEPTVLVAVAPESPWPETTAVVTVGWVRNERSAIAGAKSTSYAENVVALAYAHERGASEALMANTRGALCEGTGSNVFVVRNGRLLTPALSTGCLAGITRALVIENIDVEETDQLTLDDLRDAEEVFITSSTRDVHPVEHIDSSAMLNGAPGPFTRAASAAFAALQDRTLDP